VQGAKPVGLILMQLSTTVMKVDERRNALNNWNCRDEHSRQLRA